MTYAERIIESLENKRDSLPIFTDFNEAAEYIEAAGVLCYLDDITPTECADDFADDLETARQAALMISHGDKKEAAQILRSADYKHIAGIAWEYIAGDAIADFVVYSLGL